MVANRACEAIALRRDTLAFSEGEADGALAMTSSSGSHSAGPSRPAPSRGTSGRSRRREAWGASALPLLPVGLEGLGGRGAGVVVVAELETAVRAHLVRRLGRTSSAAPPVGLRSVPGAFKGGLTGSRLDYIGVDMARRRAAPCRRPLRTDPRRHTGLLHRTPASTHQPGDG